MSVNEKMTDIADRLRGYAQKTDKLSLDDMPSEIDCAFGQGFYYGNNQSNFVNTTEFWDIVQANGARTHYDNAFRGTFWDDTNFKPKHSMKISSAYRMYYGAINLTDLSGIDMDFSECAEFAGCWAMCSGLVALGDISFVSATSVSQILTNCKALTRVGTVTVNATTNIKNVFANLTALVDIRFAGEIGQDTSFAKCPLNRVSIESILDHLSTTSQGMTLTLKSGLVDTAFETSEGAGDGRAVFESLIAGKRNWSFSY